MQNTISIATQIMFCTSGPFMLDFCGAARCCFNSNGLRSGENGAVVQNGSEQKVRIDVRSFVYALWWRRLFLYRHGTLFLYCPGKVLLYCYGTVFLHSLGGFV